MSHHSDGRPYVELINTRHDPVLLIFSCTGNGSVSVRVRICTGKDCECAAFIVCEKRELLRKFPDCVLKVPCAVTALHKAELCAYVMLFA